MTDAGTVHVHMIRVALYWARAAMRSAAARGFRRGCLAVAVRELEGAAKCAEFDDEERSNGLR